jgi:hypothetical protein
MENMDKGLTVPTKVPTWVLFVRPKNLKCPEMDLPNMSAQAQKFGILTKKGFIGRP